MKEVWKQVFDALCIDSRFHDTSSRDTSSSEQSSTRLAP